MIHTNASITVDATNHEKRLTWSFDLATLIRERSVTVRAATDDGRSIPVRMAVLGGFVSTSFDTVSKDVPLNAALFAKHCRVKLARLKSGKPFSQTFAWEDPTQSHVRNVRVRLKVEHAGS